MGVNIHWEGSISAYTWDKQETEPCGELGEECSKQEERNIPVQENILAALGTAGKPRQLEWNNQIVD